MVYQPSERARFHQWEIRPGALKKEQPRVLGVFRGICAVDHDLIVTISDDLEVMIDGPAGKAEEIETAYRAIRLLNDFSADGFRYWTRVSSTIWRFYRDHPDYERGMIHNRVVGIKRRFHVNYAEAFVTRVFGDRRKKHFTNEGHNFGWDDAEWALNDDVNLI